MRRSVKLLILLGCLIGVCLATWWSKQHFAATAHITPMDEGVEIFSLEDASSVTWTYAGKEICFDISQGQWVYGEDPGYIISNVYQDDLLEQLDGLHARKTITDPGAPEEYGLDAPICTVTAGDRVLIFGDKTAVGGLQYASVGDGNVYMVSESAMYPFTRTLEDMINLSTAPDLSPATGITITKQDTTVTLTQDTEGLWGTEQGAFSAEDSAALSNYLQRLRYTDCLAVMAEDLSLYGLDAPCAIYTFTAGTDSFTLLFGETEEHGISVMEKDRNTVYSINQTFAEFFVQLGKKI